jgi:hypothetical protein
MLLKERRKRAASASWWARLELADKRSRKPVHPPHRVSNSGFRCCYRPQSHSSGSAGGSNEPSGKKWKKKIVIACSREHNPLVCLWRVCPRCTCDEQMSWPEAAASPVETELDGVGRLPVGSQAARTGRTLTAFWPGGEL